MVYAGRVGAAGPGAAGRAVHGAIWHACGNAVLIGLLGAVWRVSRQAHSFGWRVPNWSDRSIAGHERILAGLRAGDADETIKHTLAAIDAAEHEILARVDGNGGHEP
jgi:DNA-binding GntR family transcriptional regulator